MSFENVGLFGGTFDPIHFGHIYLAIQILEKCKLDKILFCPSNIPPHKKAHASAEHRYNMVKTAVYAVSRRSNRLFVATFLNKQLFVRCFFLVFDTFLFFFCVS